MGGSGQSRDGLHTPLTPRARRALPAFFWLTLSYSDEQCRALVMPQAGVNPPKPRAAGREVWEASLPLAYQPLQVSQQWLSFPFSFTLFFF